MIHINNMDFRFPGLTDNLFSNLNLIIDTNIRTGLIGRNGRGKSTLLSLIAGDIKPLSGNISSSVQVSIFRYQIDKFDCDVMRLVKNLAGNFAISEKLMEELLSNNRMEEYYKLQTEFSESGGDEMDYRIRKEFAAIKLDDNLLERTFDTLSSGQKIRAMITAMFLKKDAYPLIDEPANHLDMDGMDILGEYLNTKKGFLLVSHDRHLLDTSVENIISINKSDIKQTKGNYTTWFRDHTNQLEHEKRVDENIRREVVNLRIAEGKRKKWADDKEKEINGSKLGKGFISRRAAKLQKRALSITDRINKKIEEKEELLQNKEHEIGLAIMQNIRKTDNPILRVDNLAAVRGDKELFSNLSFDIYPGEKVGINGPNGCGKSTLFQILRGEFKANDGTISILPEVTIRSITDIFNDKSKIVSEILIDVKIDRRVFTGILDGFGTDRNVMDNKLSLCSAGELQKIYLAWTMYGESDLILWDEPLNYLDIASREKLEDLLLNSKCSILFIEHDRRFIENVSDRVIELNNYLN
ncbi:MAG: hypothetical protein A2355_12120 [Spirochaetes bacterium RIFOXYB1_FULL_32_8]|nr:MAG: hypothetical protein A2355_12120 [Spirochaetes bacterium RIFOXYB1_FULL_32_8]